MSYLSNISLRFSCRGCVQTLSLFNPATDHSSHWPMLRQQLSEALIYNMGRPHITLYSMQSDSTANITVATQICCMSQLQIMLNTTCKFISRHSNLIKMKQKLFIIYSTPFFNLLTYKLSTYYVSCEGSIAIMPIVGTSKGQKQQAAASLPNNNNSALLSNISVHNL